MLPTALYIHIPWCIQKCPYCDFNSHKSPANLPEIDYITALLSDLKNDLMQWPARTINSIFIGGGTPSLLSAAAYEMLLNNIAKLLPFTNDMEITLEANPGTVEQQRFREYRLLGINRLSLGIQSFNAPHLQKLGRIHDADQARNAIVTARTAGFDNINIDIMYGLPDQSLIQGVADLQSALSYQPEHLSWYQLTIEPNTVFYKQRPRLPKEDIIEEIEQAGLHMLKTHGMQRYEISAFCQPNKACLHNLNYWRFGDYYGIGAGAHGKLTEPMAHGELYRTRKQRHPNSYLNPELPYTVAIECITPAERIFEFMLNTTRLEEPIANSLFTERTGLDFNLLEIGLTTAKLQGLITCTNTHWHVTDLGRRYTNNLQAIFLPKLKEDK